MSLAEQLTEKQAHSDVIKNATVYLHIFIPPQGCQWQAETLSN
jgi:hypothetical protein